MAGASDAPTPSYLIRTPVARARSRTLCSRSAGQPAGQLMTITMIAQRIESHHDLGQNLTGKNPPATNTAVW